MQYNNGIRIKGRQYLTLSITPITSTIKTTKWYIKDEMRFAKMHLEGYAFIKDKVFNEKLPYSKIRKVKSQNIIIFFMEGTSARLLESYGGKFANLTPNISEFAKNKHSLVVTNYFNHTAATFRGTHGSLASCYPERGGYGAGQWADKNNKIILSKKPYQTLPNILNNYNYDTIFISPHRQDDAYTSLLQMLKFKEVKTLDDRLAENQNTQTHHNSLQDNDMYQWIKETLINRKNNGAFLLSAYLFETHTGVDVPKDIPKYRIDNPTLNTLHNSDKAFGKFWEWFKDSKYAHNTIIVLTADHAHYYDKDYVPLVKEQSDYREVFVDRIPLIIYDPIHSLPKTFDAGGRTSLDLTPTILHLLDIQNERNSFLGDSLFEKAKNISVSAIGSDFFLIYNNTIYKANEIGDFDISIRQEFKKRKGEIELFHLAERRNRVFFEK